jgi:flagellar protein FliJ
MKRFAFSLQKILDLRLFEQKQAEAELGKAVSEENKIQNDLDMVARQRASAVVCADGMKDITSLYNINLYFALLDQQKDQLIVQLAQAHTITETKKDAMRIAMQKCKVLEQLKEKRIISWKKSTLLAEEIQNDDIVTARFKQ